MAKRASLYLRSKNIYIISSHQTNEGFWIDDSRVIAYSNYTSEQLQNAVEEALARSQEGVPAPDPAVDLVSPLLLEAGEQSWGTFVNRAKYVGVRQLGNIVKITPYNNLGAKEGFSPVKESVFVLSSGDSKLGEAILRAFEISTSRKT